MQPPPPYPSEPEDKRLDLEAQIHVLSPITSESTSPRPPAASPPPAYPQATDETALPPTHPSAEYTSPASRTEKHRALFPYALPDGYQEIPPYPDLLSHQRALQDEAEISPFEQKILCTFIFVILLSLPGVWVGMCVDWGVGLKLTGVMVGGSAVLVPVVGGLLWCLYGSGDEREWGVRSEDR